MALDQAQGDRLSGSTSDGSALLRAFSARDPDPAVRCPDFLARRFVADLPLIWLWDSGPAQRVARWLAERRVPGGYWYESARVRHFDAILRAEVAGRVEQVVILGAGLDSRAYRFADELAGTPVFEVDHPVTAARKQQRVQAVLGAPPPNVRYVRADLAREDLGERLEAMDFAPDATVFVLWCGVTMYLSEPDVDAVLRWLAARPRGSSIAFDYDFEAFIAGDDSFYGAPQVRRVIENSGEHLSYGLDPDDIEDFLAQRGLQLESNLLPDDLLRRYLHGSDGSIAGRPYGFMGIAHGRVV